MLISSWCRQPQYGTDFGWGKPIWVSPGEPVNDVVVLIDTKDGEGIEAWIGLCNEDMAKFEKNPSICAYASFNPSIL